MSFQGDEVRGSVHSTNASAGVEVVIYDAAGAERVLGANEFLEIDSFTFVIAATGDARFFLGADATPGDGEDVFRGTVGTNAIVTQSMPRTPHIGIKGAKPWIIAASGAADLCFTGRITKA